jgi:adenylate cyclase
MAGVGGAPVLTLTPTIDWLLREGLAAGGPGALLGGVAERLAAEGLPLARATFSVTSLDPLLAECDFHWRPGGRVVESPRFHGAGSVAPAARANSAAELTLAIAGTTHRVVWTATAGFDMAARAYLESVSLLLAAPLEVAVGRATTRGLLQAYLGRRSAARVLAGAARRGTGEVIDAVIWLSDLRDFTGLSDRLPADQVILALNDSCTRLVGAIQPLGGEVLKFIGDGLLAIFPLAERGAERAAAAALAAVRAARAGMARLDVERIAAGLPGLPFGVALHLGPVMYGNIGAPDRLDFTAIGPAVNRASRIEALCRPLACPVLISREVAARCGADLAPLGRHGLRGSAESVELFTLPELASP